MGRGRQSRLKVAYRVRKDRAWAEFSAAHPAPKSFSPSVRMSWVGAALSSGFRQGYEEADKRSKRKQQAYLRLRNRPLLAKSRTMKRKNRQKTAELSIRQKRQAMLLRRELRIQLDDFTEFDYYA